MQQSVFNKSKIFNQQQENQSQHIWRVNDSKAQKNGPHSNIYWVKVFYCIINFIETAIKLRRFIKIKQMDRIE